MTSAAKVTYKQYLKAAELSEEVGDYANAAYYLKLAAKRLEDALSDKPLTATETATLQDNNWYVSPYNKDKLDASMYGLQPKLIDEFDDYDKQQAKKISKPVMSTYEKPTKRKDKVRWIKLEQTPFDFGPLTRTMSHILPKLPPFTYLAGGKVLRVIEGAPGGDWDIFFTDTKARETYLAEMLDMGWQIVDADYNIDIMDSKVAEKLRSVKLINLNLETAHGTEMAQLVLPDPLPLNIIEIFGNFDIECCKLATDGEQLFYTDQSLDDAVAKVARVTKQHIKQLTDKRTAKLAARGYEVIPQKEEVVQNVIGGKSITFTQQEKSQLPPFKEITPSHGPSNPPLKGTGSTTSTLVATDWGYV